MRLIEFTLQCDLEEYIKILRHTEQGNFGHIDVSFDKHASSNQMVGKTVYVYDVKVNRPSWSDNARDLTAEYEELKKLIAS